MSPIFFFTDTATTEIYTLSLHDALPISAIVEQPPPVPTHRSHRYEKLVGLPVQRSEEHTSELQSRPHLVCRLLLEKKKSSATAHLAGNLTAVPNGWSGELVSATITARAP